MNLNMYILYINYFDLYICNPASIHHFYKRGGDCLKSLNLQSVTELYPLIGVVFIIHLFTKLLINQLTLFKYLPSSKLV